MDDFRICSNAQCQLNYTGKCGMSSSRSTFNWRVSRKFLWQKIWIQIFRAAMCGKKTPAGFNWDKQALVNGHIGKRPGFPFKGIHEDTTTIYYNLNWGRVKSRNIVHPYGHLFSATIQSAEMPNTSWSKNIGRNATLVWQSIRLHSYATAEIKAFMFDRADR